MKGLRSYYRVNARKMKRMQDARANSMDDVHFKFRGQFYRVLRTKKYEKFFFRRQQDGGTFAEEWIKNPSATLVRKAKELFDMKDVREVHES